MWLEYVLIVVFCYNDPQLRKLYRVVALYDGEQI